ncbi:MAG: transglycosylase SLT domain-containing protein [Bdellovibrionaceae bacterium]|nr:transglycosylase SLT domain-containing protein [Pseudobdellovibrionaceae bacterium]MDW8189590.1 transglycosylase SLT domain-containing protein [Pseudobdellovibrionaceae bacterium]
MEKYTEIADYLMFRFLHCFNSYIFDKGLSFPNELTSLQNKGNIAFSEGSIRLIRREFDWLLLHLYKNLDSGDPKDIQRLLLILEEMVPLTMEQKTAHLYLLSLTFKKLGLMDEAHIFSKKAIKINPKGTNGRIPILDVTPASNLLYEIVSSQSSTSQSMERRNLDEIKIFQEFENALLQHKTNLILESGVKYLKNFPGGINAERVEKKLFENLSRYLKSENKNKLKEVPSEFIVYWLKRLHVTGDYINSKELSSITGILGKNDTAELLWILGRTNFFLGDYEQSEKNLTSLVQKYPTFKEIEDAQLKLGLGYLRTKNWIKASEILEHLIQGGASSHTELTARYWQIRALQKSGAPKEKWEKKIQELIEKFPLTFYGLVTASESDKPLLATLFPQSTFINGGQEPTQQELEMIKNNPSLLTSWETKKINRCKLLMESNFWDEGYQECREIPIIPNRSWLLFLKSLFHNWAHPAPLSLLLFDLSQNKLLSQNDLKKIFVKPFSETIEQESKRNQIDPVIVYSLIRQESQFLPLSESPSQALGLMQLLAPTALEVARKEGIYLRDWYRQGRDTILNITLGTRYLRQMIDNHQGDLLLALAAYNYGVTRLKSWRQQKKDWNQSELPYLWIDELPTSETQIYVKSIARNIIIYKLIENESFKPSETLWRNMVTSPTYQ